MPFIWSGVKPIPVALNEPELIINILILIKFVCLKPCRLTVLISNN